MCVCVPHQVLLRSIQGHKLLVVLQLPGGSKVSQLVDGASVLSDHSHDVSRFDVPVDDAVLSQVVHTCHCRRHQTSGKWTARISSTGVGSAGGQDLTHVMKNNEELIFRESVSVGGLLQDGIETAAGTVLHHQDLMTGVGLKPRQSKTFSETYGLTGTH